MPMCSLDVQHPRSSRHFLFPNLLIYYINLYDYYKYTLSVPKGKQSRNNGDNNNNKLCTHLLLLSMSNACDVHACRACANHRLQHSTCRQRTCTYLCIRVSTCFCSPLFPWPPQIIISIFGLASPFGSYCQMGSTDFAALCVNWTWTYRKQWKQNTTSFEYAGARAVNGPQHTAHSKPVCDASSLICIVFIMKIYIRTVLFNEFRMYGIEYIILYICARLLHGRHRFSRASILTNR